MALQIRRVVTGHDASGRAVVKIDEVAKNLVSSRPGATTCQGPMDIGRLRAPPRSCRSKVSGSNAGQARAGGVRSWRLGAALEEAPPMLEEPRPSP